MDRLVLGQSEIDDAIDLDFRGSVLVGFAEHIADVEFELPAVALARDAREFERADLGVELGSWPCPLRQQPLRAVLAFGTERGGLSDDLLARADATVALPMAPGVSSLNLATAVAALLFVLKLRGPR